MKKITIIEIIVVILILLSAVIYFSPKFIQNKEELIKSQVKANNAIFTSKVIEEFSKNKDSMPSLTVQKIMDEMNATQKNPYNKNEKFYVFDKDCKACTHVECDNNLRMIILTSMDKNGELMSRTVINPPSFVTYNKD